ncbi:hypothetical protein [Aeoliella mucimassa]|uniref:hypothetical protein n=1 Tax=Aeoliella mucimassa TaxID=2527972 RepID=UPI0018D3BC57|nr:hypothetical protein [Aeoliella mucimassa]
MNQASVRLVPNATHVENMRRVEKIWGKPLVWNRVPVERLDLEAQQQAENE